jgi:hypothetical protein
LFTLLLLTVPAIAIDTDKWDLVTHQEIIPHQSFPVGNYTITLAERENTGLDDYTVIVYIEQNGNRQTELMRASDTAYFDGGHMQIEYVGTRADKEVFNVYHVKNYPSNGVIEEPQNISEPVTSESANTSKLSEHSIPLDNSNLIAVGALILLAAFKKQ